MLIDLKKIKNQQNIAIETILSNTNIKAKEYIYN